MTARLILFAAAVVLVLLWVLSVVLLNVSAWSLVLPGGFIAFFFVALYLDGSHNRPGA